MTKHSYIDLCVESELDRPTARLWFETAKNNLPNGVPTSTTIKSRGGSKNSDFYVVKQNQFTCYRIPLSRDLTVAEVQRAALAWNNEYPTGDFEIDYSSYGRAHATHQEVQHTGIKEIALEAARHSHSQWSQSMSDQGWRYGQKFDQNGKTNPKLRPWDELGTKYKLEEFDRFLKLMEVLDRMNLRLVRKNQ
jgi:hypothetical protein